MGLEFVFLITLIIIGFSNCEGTADKSEVDKIYNQCVWGCSRHHKDDYNEKGASCVSSCMNFTHMTVENSNCDDLPKTFVEKLAPFYRHLCNLNLVAPKIRDWMIEDDDGVNNTGLMITLSTCNKEINWEKSYFMVVVSQYNLDLVHLNSIKCFNATLPKIKPNQISANETDRYRLNFIIDQALVFDSSYHVSVILKPKDEALLFLKAYRTQTCYNYNSDSCLCRHEGIQFPEKTESHFEGYTIRFNAPLAAPCFTVYKYEIHLLLYNEEQMYSAKSQTVTHVVDEEQTREEYDRKPYLELEFDSMFEPKKEWRWGIKVQVVDGRPWFRLYRDVALPVKNWHPPAPSVVIVNSNNIRISFTPAPPSYRIKSYWLVVSVVGDILSNITNTKAPYYKDQVRAPHVSGIDVTKTLHCLKPGHYSVEIREFRANVDTDLITRLLPAPWSEATLVFIDHPLKDDCAPMALSGEIATLVITSVIAITLSLVVIVACFYVWKKEMRPEKGRPRGGLSYVFHPQAKETEHTQINPQHFCSYLVSICGVNVIVDLFEEEEVIRGYTDWIQDAYERAEYVVFVCPHQDVTSPGDQLHSTTVGNFVTAYLYLESLISNKKKYITVLFPYADAEATAHGRWLKNVTINYRMMNDIEAFYFHLQGKSRMFINGRRSVEFISNRDFHQTNEGAALLRGFQHFAKLSSAGSISVGSGASDNIDEKTPLNMIEEVDNLSSPGSVLSASALSIRLEEPNHKGSSGEKVLDGAGDGIVPPDSVQVVYHKLDIVPPKVCGEDEL